MRSLICLTVALGWLSQVTAAPADGQGELQAVLAKAIKAHGGEANLAKCKASTTKMKGTVNINGMSIDMTTEVMAQIPGQMKMTSEIEVMGMKFTVLQVFNGDKGWIKLNDKVMELDKDAVAEAREQMHGHWIVSLLPLRDKAYKLSSAGTAQVDGKEAIGILVTHKDYRDITLFFDKETGLLVKTEGRAKDVQNGGQEYTAETFLSNYKDFGGVQRPTKAKLKRDGKDFAELETTDFQVHDKLEDSVFAKP